MGLASVYPTADAGGRPQADSVVTGPIIPSESWKQPWALGATAWQPFDHSSAQLEWDPCRSTDRNTPPYWDFRSSSELESLLRRARPILIVYLQVALGKCLMFVHLEPHFPWERPVERGLFRW